MAWEIRGNGRRQYFYRSERQADGRVRKRYIGKGLLAEVESSRLERKASLRRRELQERKAILELESVTTDYAKSARIAVEAHFYAAGFHNPNSRGWRKRRGMIRPNEANEANEANDMRSQSRDPAKNETKDIKLGELVSRCRRGDRHAAKTLGYVILEHPNLFKGLAQVSATVQLRWIRVIHSSDLFDRTLLVKATSELKQALLAEGSGTQLERLVVEQVVSSQLQLAFHESREAEAASRGAEVSKYRLDAIERASRRHMKALGALATLRTVMPSLEQKRGSQLTTPVEEASENSVERIQQTGVNRLSGAFQNGHAEFSPPRTKSSERLI